MRPVLVGVVALIAGLVTVPAWSGYTTRLAVDEPAYALSAESLARDGDLDLANQYAAHLIGGAQSQPRPGGALYAPHGPGLAWLLAPGARLGWVGMRASLAVIFGLLGWALAALAGRLELPLWPVALVMLSPPLLVPSTQVYPEVAAGLVIVLCLHGLLQPQRWTATAVGVAVAALVWLGGPKYALASAALVGLTAWRCPARTWWPGLLLALSAGAGALAFNLSHFGGLVPQSGFTPYQGIDAVAAQVGFIERAPRLVGLLLDRRFGLLVWAPVLALAAPGLPALRRRGLWLLWPLAAQWASATWLALTMRGYAFPGRHLLAALPLAALPVAASARTSAGTRAVVVLGLISASTAAAAVVAVDRGSLAVAVDVFTLRWLPFRALQAVLPDFRAPAAALGALWLALLGWAGWRSVGRRSVGRLAPT